MEGRAGLLPGGPAGRPFEGCGESALLVGCLEPSGVGGEHLSPALGGEVAVECGGLAVDRAREAAVLGGDAVQCAEQFIWFGVDEVVGVGDEFVQQPAAGGMGCQWRKA